MRRDKKTIEKVLPCLPEWMVNWLTNPQFEAECLETFAKLDADGNGTLDPAELHPVIVDMCQAHPFSVDLEQCKEFASIFDEDKNGTIDKDEFVDFCLFVVVMCFLSTPEGEEVAVTAECVAESTRSTQEMLEMMRRDKKTIEQVLPFLPEWMVNWLTNPQFEAECLETFAKLDADGNGTLDPAELHPVIVDMCQAHPLSVDLEQCKEFASIFDEDKNGTISKEEFVDFCIFVVVMCFLSSPEGEELAVTAECVAESTRSTSKMLEMMKRD